MPRGWTVDEYLRLELESPVKHEYVDGHVYAMAGGTQAHSELGVVAVALLRTLVRGGPCRAFNSDLKVHVSPRIYFYPDASVSCDPRDRHTGEAAGSVDGFPRDWLARRPRHSPPRV